MTQSSVDRRTLLGAVALGASAATGGCMRRLRSATGWDSVSPVSLEVKTLPADSDSAALQVARNVAAWFGTAGIDATVTPMAPEELYRQVLLANDFEVFVARLPAEVQSPDALYALLHSRFAEEPGWQNPFGYANMSVDSLLETQRRTTGPPRREAVEQLQRTVAETQPFSVVAFPDDIRAVRTSRFDGWQYADLRSPLGYFSLERASADETDQSDGTLRVVVTDSRSTENLNPLAAEYRSTGALTGLLYDPLGYEDATGTTVPWLAESWVFPEVGGNPTARVRLRRGLSWHDGTDLTAADVEFTYALLVDTTLGHTGGGTDTESDAPVAAPRFRGRSSLVADVRPLDDRTVEVQFEECDPGVATRAFTVPILPKHVWSDRTDPASFGGLPFGTVTEALVTNNIPPVGSGPVTFARNTPRERVVFERFEGHFSAGDPPSDLPAVAAGGLSFDRLLVRVVGTDETAVSIVDGGEADATGTPVDSGTVPRIGRSDALDLAVGRSPSPYVLGYNTQRPPLSNPRFRNVLARLVDAQSMVTGVFDGYARPAVSALAGTRWLPPDLEWGDGNPVTPFLGSNGTLDVDAAREAFREAGYRYDDGTLVESD